MDSRDFEEQVQPYRAELLAHCYRMTGALSDAEDALQNALVRAWRGLDAFEGRSNVRTWLYKIATNACLDLLTARKARSMPEYVEGDQAADAAWLEPFPTPDDAYSSREAVRLAFVVALQVLPPKQRAALILFDVVGMSADEVAATLDTTVAAVNSALQRARAVVAEHPRAKKKPITDKIGELLGKYLALWEAGDARGLVALLRDDAVFSMPPMPLYGRGPDAIAGILEQLVFPRGAMRMLPTTINGAPAFAVYRDGKFEALSVLDIEDGRIAAVQSFLQIDPAAYGLPATLESRVELVPGAELGRYRLEYVLGSGGMGQVWLAHDRELERDVALKVLRDELAADDASRARLLAEARAMAKLRHPNVLGIYDVTQLAGHDVLVMELVEGETLATWARRRDQPAVIDALVAAGRGLAAAHAAKLVHRDFKPDNVLVGHDGRVVVADFGLARSPGARVSQPAIPIAADGPATVVQRPIGLGLDATRPAAAAPSPSAEPLTREGTVIGTPRYMAPEHYRGEDVDARGDQFAFCVSAWELLAGTPPFSAEELVDLARGGTALPRGTVPARFAPVLMRGLAPNRDERWPSMTALLDEMARA